MATIFLRCFLGSNSPCRRILLIDQLQPFPETRLRRIVWHDFQNLVGLDQLRNETLRIRVPEIRHIKISQRLKKLNGLGGNARYDV